MSTNKKPFHWNATNLRAGIEAAGVALWSWNVDTDQLEMDELGFDLWSMPKSKTVSFEDLSEKIHPADRDRVRTAFAATRSLTGPYEIDFRILSGDEVRWVSARGKGSDDSVSKRMVFGIFLDVTGRKQAEEAHELLAGEMSHRVKNLLAIAGALTSMSSRSTSTAKEMAEELTGRLSALGRAHEYVRPHAAVSDKTLLVGDLISVVLAPYDNLGSFIGRVRVSVPRLAMGDTASTNLALLIHEMATNSLKYGALSSESGILDVSGHVEDGEFVMCWVESGGPPILKEASSKGFGSQLIERVIKQFFKGSSDIQWAPEGVKATLRLNLQKVLA